MANKPMKRCLSLLINREMNIKTTVMHHLTPFRMVITKMSINNKCWRGCGEKGNLLHCRVGMQTGAASMESIIEAP